MRNVFNDLRDKGGGTRLVRNSCSKILGTKDGGQFFNYLGDKGWEDKAGEKYILGIPGQRVGEKAGEKQLFRNLEDKA